MVRRYDHLAPMTYSLAYDARWRAGPAGPGPDPGAAAGAGLVPGRPGRPLLPEPVHAEPDRARPPADQPGPADHDRPGPGDQHRSAGRVGRRRRGDPAAAR